MWCSGCEAAFERIDCADHGDDCPELVCVICGEGAELAVAPQRVAAVTAA